MGYCSPKSTVQVVPVQIGSVSVVLSFSDGSQKSEESG
jgi:hypothetical protein